MARLTDEYIDRLVSEHIFGKPGLCTGFVRGDAQLGMLRCTECDATFDRAVGRPFFEEAGHIRAIPQYSKNAAAWTILDSLRWLPQTTQVCFALFLDALVYEEETRKKPQTFNACTKHQLLFGASPRLICLAALQAIDVIGADGSFVEGKAAS
jgi:hypothetical protein